MDARTLTFQMTGKKSNSTLDWEDVRFFAALARHGTVAAAAQALKVTETAVARRLDSLEAVLGSPLFVRRTRGYTLTATGASVLAEAGQMEMAACALSQMCIGNFPATVTGVPACGHRSSAKANRE